MGGCSWSLSCVRPSTGVPPGTARARTLDVAPRPRRSPKEGDCSPLAGRRSGRRRSALMNVSRVHEEKPEGAGSTGRFRSARADAGRSPGTSQPGRNHGLCNRPSWRRRTRLLRAHSPPELGTGNASGGGGRANAKAPEPQRMKADEKETTPRAHQVFLANRSAAALTSSLVGQRNMNNVCGLGYRYIGRQETE